MCSVDIDSGFEKSVNRIASENGLSSIGKERLQYCERYHFEFDDQKFWIDFHYRKNNLVSSLNTNSNIDEKLKISILEIFESLIGKPIIESTAEMMEIKELEFPEDKPFLKEFCAHIQSKLQAIGIKIVNLKHLQYFERYEFVQNTERAVIDFFYDSKGEFTKPIPKPSLGNSEILLNKIKEIIREE